MSFANEKGGYTKVLEVTRENSNRSVTMLKDDFLADSGKYILNVTDFITSTSPPLNEIDEAYFTILPRGAQNESIEEAEDRTPDFLQGIAEFRPTKYRTWMELARQMDNWFKDVTNAYLAVIPEGNENFAKFKVDRSGQLQIELSVNFLSQDAALNQINLNDGNDPFLGLYIKIGTESQKVLGMTERIFKVNDGTRDFNNADDSQEDLLIADINDVLRFSDKQTQPVESQLIQISQKPISNYDQRLSIDVYSTFPLKSKILTENGKEGHDHILFRIPFDEQHSFSTTVSYSQIENQVLPGAGAAIEEDVDIGLTNLCDKHPTTLHQLLLSGVIRSVQLKVMIRYINSEEIIERDIDFTNGFWYIRLLFVKKV